MSGPWTLVTGGAQGLGAEICKTLASVGHSVVIHTRKSQEEAENVALQCRKECVDAEWITGDFATKEGVEAFCEEYLFRFGQTAHVVNNVGNYFVASLVGTPIVEFYSLMQTNLHAPLMIAKMLLPSLKGTRGSILNIGVAGVSHLRADLHSSFYTLTKQALWGATLSLAKELAPEGVRVNMVSPGYLENTIDQPKHLPMGRLATLAETARVVAFLLDSNSSYITGQNIDVAGGVRL